MIFIIEGLQGVGKTTLIKALNIDSHKFSFTDYIKEFHIDSKDELNSFQIGKDLGMLFGLNLIPNNQSVVIDRGPLSSVYYSIKEGRKIYSEGLLYDYFDELKKFNNIHYIFIDKCNDNNSFKRERGDGFDYLNDQEDSKKDFYLSILKLHLNYSKLNLSYFTNDFSKSVKENAKRLENLIKEITNEHK